MSLPGSGNIALMVLLVKTGAFVVTWLSNGMQDVAGCRLLAGALEAVELVMMTVCGWSVLCCNMFPCLRVVNRRVMSDGDTKLIVLLTLCMSGGQLCLLTEAWTTLMTVCRCGARLIVVDPVDPVAECPATWVFPAGRGCVANWPGGTGSGRTGSGG